jgi:hypothetical protein
VEAEGGQSEGKNNDAEEQLRGGRKRLEKLINASDHPLRHYYESNIEKATLKSAKRLSF